MTAYGMLMTALPSKNAATKIARKLIDERLAACVQLSAIESFYRWKGQTVTAPESLLLIKTSKARFDAAIARIKELHPYDVPEIVGADFTAGFKAYFDWVDEATKPLIKKPPAKKATRQASGRIAARTSTRMRTGISRPMRVK